MYPKASTNLKSQLVRKMGNEAVDHKMDLSMFKLSFIQMFK